MNSKIILKSSLDKIVINKDIEESIKDATEAISSFASLSDNTRLFMAKRVESEYLQEQQDYNDLKVLGNYQVKRTNKKDTKTISFIKQDYSIEFIFHKKNFSLQDSFSMMQDYSKEKGEENLESLTSEMILEGVKGNGKTTHPNEILLGKKSQNIESYFLKSVNVLRKTKKTLLGYKTPFDTVNREEIYTHKEE
jgi:hypothetical protein